MADRGGCLGFFEGLLKQKVTSVFFGSIMDGRNEVYRQFRVTNPDIEADFNVMFVLAVVMAACLRVPVAADDDIYNQCVADIKQGLIDYFKGQKDAPINAADYMRQAFATSFQEHVGRLIQRSGQFGLDLPQAAMDFLITILEKNNIAAESAFYMLDRMAMYSLMSAYMQRMLIFKSELSKPKHLCAG